MDYFIEAYKNNRSLLGSANATLVYQAKNLVKVNNCLKWFKPDREYDEIRIFSFTNLYDEKTHKLVRVISPQLHTEIKNGLSRV